jgi:peptidoglycan/xylan/chitin deacetylase (PgdA/CDA1 family)
VSLRSPLGAIRNGILSHVYRRVIPFTKREPIISFTFDDFPRTAYIEGGSILEAFGARGTYYAAPRLMNTSGEVGAHFNAEDLLSLLGKGHELANHTFDHISSRSVSCSDFYSNVEKGRRALEERTGVKPRNFSYPFGDVTLCAKQAVGGKVASARSIIPGFNGPEVDLNLLRANKLYGDIDQAGRLNELIEENVRRKGWLIFYTHDVRPQPSPYGCTPELFQSVASAAVASASEILSVDQALISLGIQPATAREAELARVTQS